LIVLDASALVELLLATPTGRRLAERLRSPALSLHAPELIDIEVAYVSLAEVLDATLVTTDRRLAAAPGVRAAIEVH